MIADAAEADRSLIKQVIKNIIYKLGLGIRLSVPPERLATISDAFELSTSVEQRARHILGQQDAVD
jgi:transcription initiation factor TFIIIB Brf1 subunit/transcription initiation factor TFIIB